MNNNLLDIVSFCPDDLRSDSAWLGHLPFSAWLIQEVAPSVFVELGTHLGHSYFSFSKSVLEHDLPTKCYAVDTWAGDKHAGFYGDDIYLNVCGHNSKRYSRFSHLMRMTFDEAANHFSDESIGLLHIDGLHTYAAVRHDFETWLPKLAPGAVVLFHDTNVYERGFGVWKFWRELQERYPNHIEFFHSSGLGILQLNNADAFMQIEWLKPGYSDKERLVDYFEAVGSRQRERHRISDLEQICLERDSFSYVFFWFPKKTIKWTFHLLSGAVKGIRQAGHILRLAHQCFRRNGGVRSTFLKGFRILRREGKVGGIKRLRSIFISWNDYTRWTQKYDVLTDTVRNAMQRKINCFSFCPLISVVMPVYNPRPEWLVEAIESVQNQIYPFWELCIADDLSSDEAVRPILERYAREDSRIKVVFREENGHISAASNSALELVSGEWVALLDHDDIFSEHALFWVADTINKNPEARLIYSDEDKIDEDGIRFGPYFKSDWNIDLFYSHNMFSHLGVYEMSLLKDVGGFRVGLEGSQDYDLCLRCCERIRSEQILHIPRVLYHWRAHAESTARGMERKPYAALAGERACNEHFQRQKISAYTEYIGGGYRAHYALPEAPPLVSLIILTKNSPHFIKQCVESLFEKTSYDSFEIIIVDNGSDDPETLRYLDSLESNALVKVVRDTRPFDFSALNNAAVEHANGELIALLNDDVEALSEEWLSEMVSIALQPGVGVVGAKLMYSDGSLQHGGVILGLEGAAGRLKCGSLDLIRGCSAVSFACAVFRRNLWIELGGLDEKNLTVAFTDVDFCLRAREAGYRNVWTPYAELFHHESVSRGAEDTDEKRRRFAGDVDYMEKRWEAILMNDPAYNLNLTLERPDCSFSWPPRLSPFPDE